MTMTQHRTDLPTRLKVSVETVTPALAATYLANMNNPRKLRDAVVDRYARDMAAGHWVVGTSAISFDALGVTRDGQHRLQACIKAGVPFETVVHRGITEDAVLNMDRGLKRAWADALKARGLPNANNLQSATVLAWRWDHGLFGHGRMANAPTIPELEDWFEANPQFVDNVHDAVSLRAAIGCNTAAMASFIYRTQTIDAEASALMVDQLRSGDLAATSPLRKLRDRTMITSNSRRRGALGQVVELAVACKSWNAWVTGRSIQNLSWRRGPSVRESFPDLVDDTGTTWPFPDVVARMMGDEE